VRRSRLSGKTFGGEDKPLGRTALLTLLAVAVFGACSIPLRIVVVNQTAEPVTLTLRLERSAAHPCEAKPRSMHLMPSSQIDRWLREPERRPAEGVAFRETDCSVAGTIAARTALELEYGSHRYWEFHESAEGAFLQLRGAAGRIELEGAQLRNHVSEGRSGKLLLRYGA
jgi:hypothetical protein